MATATDSASSEFDLFGQVKPATLRSVAAGAGDWSLVVVREVSRILSEVEKDRPAALARGIDELRSRDVITAEEVEDLKSVTDAFFTAARDKSAAKAGEATVLDRYRRLSLDRNASPVAVAIVSVAARNMTVPEPPEVPGGPVAVAVVITPGSTGAGAVTGAIIGAGIGAVVGGGVGAGIGAVIGGAAGAAIGFSNENGI